MGESGNLIFKGKQRVGTHVPVLADEVVSWIGGRSPGCYVDCTVGEGGLATRLLDQLPSGATFLGIDRDEEALAVARSRLEGSRVSVHLIHGNFCDLKAHLESVNMSEVHGVIFDLGVSSAQLEEPERGFSVWRDGPLDMRMDRRSGRTAADLLAGISESELADLIWRYGEERYARRIARAIVRSQPLARTRDLVEVIQAAVPRPYRYGRIHCATRTFQAIRMAVNGELEALEKGLQDAMDVLALDGRICVISFHSLEDRIVKHTFRTRSQDTPPSLVRLTKKPQLPSEQERRRNPRARSAKLRVAQRV